MITRHEIDVVKSDIHGLIKTPISQSTAIELDRLIMKLVEIGRLSVLQEFDDMCAADAFVGFPADEWTAIKKFFAVNKEISNWDKNI